MQKLGLRRFYLISIIGCVISSLIFFVANFFLESTNFSVWIAVAAVTFFQAAGNMGVMSVPFALPALWVPIKHRTICMAALVIVGLLTLFGWSTVFPYLLIRIGNYTFLIFSVIMVLNLGYGWYFVKLDDSN